MNSSAGKNRRALTIIELLVSISIIGIAIALIAPAIMIVRQSAWSLQCQNNARTLTQALIQYDCLHRHLPGSSTSSLHDWAIAILPEIEQADHFRQFIPEFYASDPVNMVPARTIPRVYLCPVNPDYCSFIPEILAGHYGLNAHFSERSLASAPCLSQTILIGELPSGLSMPWITSPAISGTDLGFLHNGSSNVAFADGHVERIKVGNHGIVVEPIAGP